MAISRFAVVPSIFSVCVRKKQGVELPRVPDDRLSGGAAEQCDQRNLRIVPVPECLRERRLRRRTFFLHLRERRRLGELQANPDGEAEQDDRQQERHAPAPIGKLRGRHAETKRQNDDQRQEQADSRRRLDPRRVEAATALRRMLCDVGRCTTVFATKREALCETTENEDDRRCVTDGREARQQTDDEGRDAHQGHRDKECVFAADHVAEATEEQRAERTNRETGGKTEQHEDELRGVVVARHEGLRDIRGQRAREIKIIPFENRAGGRRDDDLAFLRGHRACCLHAPCSSCHCHCSLPPHCSDLMRAPLGDGFGLVDRPFV